MSKTSDLRRKATEAVRHKQYQKAVELYEKICGLDPGNGSPRNELGDVYLKLGDVELAIASFTEAARLYLDYGLTNNAVAVHKKILRHDPNHLHSLWVLGEIRLDQGLDVEANTAFMEFLGRAESVPEAERDAFVARGLELVERMGDDLQILGELDSIFGRWDFGQERARVLVAKAKLAHEEQEHDVRDKYIEHARAAFEHLDALPDYVQFKKIFDPDPADEPDEVELELPEGDGTITLDDQDTIVLDGEDLSAALQDSPIFDAPGPDGADHPAGSTRLNLDSGELDLGFDFDASALSGAVESLSSELEQNSEERAVLGTDDEAGADPAGDDVEIVRPFETHADTSQEELSDDAPTVEPEPEVEPDTQGSVDLLEQILSDESFDVQASDQSQVDTIAQEMQGQLGSDVEPTDYAGQYELGIVYLDMALFDQAIACFDLASEGIDERLRAMEMKGTCLLRLDQVNDAIAVFEAGLAVPGYPGQAYLGLLYGVGTCHELRDEAAIAIDYFERVAAVDASFLDVERRLERLQQSSSDSA